MSDKDESDASARAAWKQRWRAMAVKPDGMSEEEWEKTEDFWRNKFFRSESGLVRCLDCEFHMQDPPPEDELDTTDINLMPCGCNYQASMYELVMGDCGVFLGDRIPEHVRDWVPWTLVPWLSVAGRNSMECHKMTYLLVFEVAAGKWSWEKMVPLLGKKSTGMPL